VALGRRQLQRFINQRHIDTAIDSCQDCVLPPATAARIRAPLQKLRFDDVYATAEGAEVRMPGLMVRRRIDAAAARHMRANGAFVEVRECVNDISQPEAASSRRIRQAEGRFQDKCMNGSHSFTIHV
jgi:hypothetical protein